MNNRQIRDGASFIVDRGWSLHVGPFTLVQWHRCYADHARSELRPMRSQALLFSGRTALSAVVVCMCTLAATSLVAERVGARSAYSITIPVPPKARHIPIARPTSGPGYGDERTATAATMTSGRRLAAAVPAAVRDSSELPLSADASLQPSSEMISQALAVQTALATGGMQEWREASPARHGFVVAGLLQEEDGRQCRAMSVLTRSADGDVVEQRHDCLR
jgi:hypothetical protein